MVADRWSVETIVPTPRFHAGVTRVGGTIYIIGGFLDDDMFDRATGVTGIGVFLRCFIKTFLFLDCYDMNKGIWSKGSEYPQVRG